MVCQIAIVGAGLIGSRHIEAIHEVDGCSVSAIVDPQSDAQIQAVEYGVPYWTELAAMLDAHRPDGAVIATPTPLHRNQGVQCLEAGIPTLIEKPLAHNLADAAALVDAGARTGVPILVGHHRRHNPWVAEAKARIESGALGQLVALHASCWLMKPDDYFEQAWRRQPGGGPLSINLIHDIDLIRYLCGEFVEVQAMASNANRSFAVEDTVVINARLAGGALLTLTLSDTITAPWSYELTAAENPAYPRTGQSCYWLGGTHGALQLPDAVMWKFVDERSWWAPIDSHAVAMDHADPLPRQIMHFVDVIHGKASPLISAEEGWRNMRVLDAIQRAVDTRTTVTLESA